MPDPYLAMKRVLNEEARDVIMASAHAMNPQLNGADVADVLDIYDMHDGCLFFTEPLWEQHRKDIPTRPAALIHYYRAASIAVALMLGSSEEPNPLTWLLVELLAKAAAGSDGVVAP